MLKARNNMEDAYINQNKLYVEVVHYINGKNGKVDNVE